MKIKNDLNQKYGWGTIWTHWLTALLIIMPDQPLVIDNIYYEFDRSALSDIANVARPAPFPQLCTTSAGSIILIRFNPL